MNTPSNAHVVPMTKRHARAAARLHVTGITTGFLSKLGAMFLRQLYKALPSCPAGFGYVWQEGDGEVLGFIACAENIGKLYREALWRRGVLMSLPLIRFLVRPSTLKRMWETFRYPAETAKEALPPAEVLSIVVAKHARGKGVGRALIEAALREFAGRSVRQVKVALWTRNVAANEFYKKCGFRLAVTREHHGLPMNVYVIQTGETA